MKIIVLGILAGAFSTFVMDVASWIGSKLHLSGKTSPILIGRWFKIIFTRGKFVHEDIRQAETWKYEHSVGMLIHYVIGAILGVVFLLLFQLMGLRPTNFLDAILYGLATSVFAWFWMFPAFGFGFFGKNGPPEFPAFRTSTLTHFSFGVGLGLWFNVLLLLHIYSG